MIENHRSTVRRALTLALLAALAACTSDSTSPNDPGPPPELPPLTSMSGDFSIFGAPGALHAELAPEASLTSLNFVNAGDPRAGGTGRDGGRPGSTRGDVRRGRQQHAHVRGRRSLALAVHDGPGWPHVHGPPQRSGPG